MLCLFGAPYQGVHDVDTSHYRRCNLDHCLKVIFASFFVSNVAIFPIVIGEFTLRSYKYHFFLLKSVPTNFSMAHKSPFLFKLD